MINFYYKSQDMELSKIQDDYDEKDDNCFDNKHFKVCKHLICYDVVGKV